MISRVGEHGNYTLPYPSSNAAGCTRSSVEIAARPVRPGGAPGFYIDLVGPEGDAFEYHQQVPIRLRPHRVAQATPF